MTTATNNRFATLDVFRGLTVFLMIIVNTQGSMAKPYPFLEHAAWNGCTLADLVFPSFLFAAGNAMVFTRPKLISVPRSRAWYIICKRGLLIFAIGYLLSWYPFIAWNAEGDVWLKPFGETRFLSVLQRIAITYVLAALITLYGSLRLVWSTAVVLLTGYWAILFFAGDHPLQYELTGNAVRKLDLLLIGPEHMYREKGIAFDPEGLLSTIPAIVNVLAGYLAGDYIIRKGITVKCMERLFVAGIILLPLALLWSKFLPVNKKLWTGSFVLLSTAIDLLVLALLFYFIEIRKSSRGVYFFTVFGRNPLFIYVLSNLLGTFFILHVKKGLVFIDWINGAFFQKIAPGSMGCLLFSLAFTMICWMVGWLMDRKKIYIRL